MNRPKFFKFGLGSFIAVPLLMLLLLLFFHWENIELEVAANANSTLAVQQPWARAETFNRGRDVLIVGTAPNQAAADDALVSALGAPGVRQASFAGDISPPLAPANMYVVFEADTVIVSGASASNALINNLIAKATHSFTPRKIVNRLEVVDNTAGVRSVDAIFESGDAFRPGIKLNFAGSTLTVAGEMPDEQSSQSLIRQLSAGFEGKIINQLQFTPAEPVIPCQVEVNEILATSKINFEIRESTIDRSSFGLLRNLAEILRNCPAASVQVIGHTDSRGILESNQSLSERRAASVVKFFAESGLNPKRFEVIGEGSNKPIADNQTAQGRAQNRRIEFKLKI